VATGSAGRVEGDPDRKAAEDLPHDRLLDLEELVPRLVVERRPPVVAFARRDGTRLDALAQLVGRIEGAWISRSRASVKVSVVRAGECTQELYALQAEQIRQRPGEAKPVLLEQQPTRCGRARSLNRRTVKQKIAALGIGLA
jgi:hypothetical protein